MTTHIVLTKGFWDKWNNLVETLLCMGDFNEAKSACTDAEIRLINLGFRHLNSETGIKYACI